MGKGGYPYPKIQNSEDEEEGMEQSGMVDAGYGRREVDMGNCLGRVVSWSASVS